MSFSLFFSNSQPFPHSAVLGLEKGLDAPISILQTVSGATKPRYSNKVLQTVKKEEVEEEENATKIYALQQIFTHSLHVGRRTVVSMTSLSAVWCLAVTGKLEGADRMLAVFSLKTN